MSTAPRSITDLAAVWTSHGGVNLGIVGNAAHTSGYHLGKDRIFASGGQGWNDYSVKYARDKAGLTNAASALDLGKLGGSLGNLRAFSRDLVARLRADATLRHDVREVIYSPDGVKVQRWSGADNLIHTGPGNGDSSHLSHTHISFWRDSESRSKTALFAPYFPPPPAPEDDMPALTAYIPGQVATIKPTANVRTAPLIAAGNVIRAVTTAETWTVTGWVKGGVDPDGGSDQWLCRWAGGKWEYTAKSNATSGPAVPPDTTPFTQAQLDAASAAAIAADRAKAHITWEA